MDKEEVRKLSKELWELSENEEKNIQRMKEIAHILVTYYMWWTTVWDAEDKSVNDSDAGTVKS